MIKNIKLTNQINRQLPAELVDFLRLAGTVATELQQRLYLVGGVVRDLLLERNNLDLDLVVEGDAIKVAEELAKRKKGRIIAHSRFGTAKIKWDKWSVDIATSRVESYDKPGALPTIRPVDIQSDLARRDFTINAMAVHLDPSRWGELIDLFKGQEDLEKKLVRILYDNTFKDDATRIWRAVRYEQRLDFRIEPHTLDLLKRDISYLDTISGDRIRHELELCLEEEKPEKVLLQASELGLLEMINASLKADQWLARKIAKARGVVQPYSPPEDLYLAFLVYRLNMAALEQVISYLRFPRSVAQTLEDAIKLKNDLHILAEPALKPSLIYRSLCHYPQTAILANLLAADSIIVRQRIEFYLNKLRHVQPALTGDDLREMGVSSGPRIKEILDTLREARLDGKVTTEEEEEEMVKASFNLSS